MIMKMSTRMKVDGEGCNDGLEGVADKFSVEDGVDQCFRCQYYENLDGTVSGQPFCKELLIKP